MLQLIHQFAVVKDDVNARLATVGIKIIMENSVNAIMLFASPKSIQTLNVRVMDSATVESVNVILVTRANFANVRVKEPVMLNVSTYKY